MGFFITKSMRIAYLLLICTQLISAQKVVQKTLINPEISFIKLDVSNCFEVELETAQVKEMVIEATIEGEYKDDLIINVEEAGKTLSISSGFQQNFVHPNDKLSAHKVISIKLKIQLPENKNLNVYGTNTNIWLTGIYEHLKITLNDGFTKLHKVVGKAEVITQSGNIFIESVGAEISSASKFGKVYGDQIPKGNSKYILNTISGNIHFKRME